MIDREPLERDPNSGRKPDKAVLRHHEARSDPRSLASRTGMPHSWPPGAGIWEIPDNAVRRRDAQQAVPTQRSPIMNIRRVLSRVKQDFYKQSRPSLNDLDQKLEKYLNFRDGFFIEVGANDGYSQSNTYFLEKTRGWNGLLIEGIPELFEKCKKRRANSIVINCALVANDFPHSTVQMHYAHLMSVVDGSLKSDEEQNKHLSVGINVQNLGRSYSINVPARTLDSILDDIQDLPTIGFFSLDVEGYELKVLQGLNLTKYRPQYILVEARFFEEVHEFLIAHKYEMLEKLSHHDVLYSASVS